MGAPPRLLALLPELLALPMAAVDGASRKKWQQQRVHGQPMAQVAGIMRAVSEHTLMQVGGDFMGRLHIERTCERKKEAATAVAVAAAGGAKAVAAAARASSSASASALVVLREVAMHSSESIECKQRRLRAGHNRGKGRPGEQLTGSAGGRSLRMCAPASLLSISTCRHQPPVFAARPYPRVAALVRQFSGGKAWW